jgi:IS4 transposase
VESSARLGRHRWTVERSLAWLVANRRLTVRDERRAEILTAFLHLACALIGARQAPIALNHFQAAASPRLRSSNGCLGARRVRSVAA